MLVELDPDLAERARSRAAQMSATIEVVTGDASSTSSYAGAVPADVVLACGIFGNVTDDDIHNTVEHLPSLCAPQRHGDLDARHVCAGCDTNYPRMVRRCGFRGARVRCQSPERRWPSALTGS